VALNLTSKIKSDFRYKPDFRDKKPIIDEKQTESKSNFRDKMWNK